MKPMNGMMECWSIGVAEWSITPALQHSSTLF